MDQEHELRRSQRRAWIVAVCIVVPGVLLFVCLRFLVATPRVPTKAMSPTVHARDRVVVNNLAYLFDEPRVGDVVAYRDRYGHLYRIVAGPGDTIQMRDNVLFLNGKRRHEPYIQLTPDVAAVRTFGPVTVPAGHYFLLGDNRDNANDSRFQGFIARGKIKGKMIRVLHIGECTEAR